MQSSLSGIPAPPVGACFFLDFDGTLVDFAATPATIAVPAELVTLLQTLGATHGGALAIVTGRALPDIDHYLAPLRLPVAALHGTVRRDASGQVCGDTSTADFRSRTAPVRECLRRWATRYPGLLLEDKGLALAVHFRALSVTATERQALQQAVHCELAATLPAAMELLVGDLVLEVRDRGTDKGSAVAAFLAETPFSGRFPVYLGDDLADTSGMAVVERHGGLAIAVGHRVQARWHLPSPTAARAWLAGCLRRGDRP